jgi:hypothetical protein
MPEYLDPFHKQNYTESIKKQASKEKPQKRNQFKTCFRQLRLICSVATDAYVYKSPNFENLTNSQNSVIEGIWGDLHVQRSGASADATGCVVVRTVARAKPSSVITSVFRWHASKMCAHSNYHQPNKNKIKNQS